MSDWPLIVTLVAIGAFCAGWLFGLLSGLRRSRQRRSGAFMLQRFDQRPLHHSWHETSVPVPRTHQTAKPDST